AVLAAVGAAVLAAVPALARSAGGLLPPDLPGVPPSAALVLLAAAVVLVLLADRGLGRIGAGSLRSTGATASYASASAVSMDFRDLGRALGGRPRAPRRPRRFTRVVGPSQAVVAADLLLLARSPWQLGQLVAAVALPVLAVRTEGLDRLPVAGAVGLLLGWLAAAVAVGHPARQAQAAPALDRLLPLSPARVVAARCVVPALALAVVCGCGGLLIGQGSGDAAAWALLALGTVPAWTAASLRGAYRPELDWAGPVVSTPMGIIPAGAAATTVQGVDVGLLGSLPLVAALLLGGHPGPGLLAAQWGWAAALCGLALTALARRRAKAWDRGSV
ncbi:DUF6297 family protein, partial [Blastococcus sp. TF02A_35]|uniref:DUF6297 family protein n=1 Tax=Blastococcus sp. TF02A-35 TaxID=2559612 RepID=UPI001ADD9CD5